MPAEHVIPGFKGKIHDPIALAREMFDNRSSGQKKDIFDASQLLNSVRDLQGRLKDAEEKIAEHDKIVNRLLTASK